jgi:hypothetical protein
MRKPATTRVLRIACLCALAALALMSWSLFDPRPLPVILAMSVGQVLGTLSFLAFLYVVALDLRPFARTDSKRLDARDKGIE